MNNLKTLIIQPKEYFKEISYIGENKKPIKLRYLFSIFIVIGLINYLIQDNVSSSEPIIPGGNENISSILVGIFGIFGELIGAWICVNILYLVIKIFLKLIEHKEIEDKKYFKSILYFRYIMVRIANLILMMLVSFFIKDSSFLTIVGSINNLFIKLWATYLLYEILKYYIGTSKLHKILPAILYIFTIIGVVIMIALATLMPSMAI